ncbi:hypothetical protein Daus18300_003808 [Diaporthe australafricana]|uniref:Uncharacterized protein n=1 Tax=Diaporthe australafricana TaxID=127596 RepID=A0ABR3XD98_9PEZI
MNPFLPDPNGSPATRAPSLRDLRAVRRGQGIPANNPDSPNSDGPDRGSGRYNINMDLDVGFDEHNQVSSYDPDSSSDSEGGEANGIHGANNGPARDMILLHDSKFHADRTDMRVWHELRYVRTLWTRAEEDKLQKDILVITDGCDKHVNANAMLWTACFDRYGAPLSDIFTYGLRPHPANWRLARQKLLSPVFCDHLTSVMVHPIFQGNAVLLRYILQRIICIRVDIHYPPMGTMPDMINADLERVDYLAETLQLEEDSPEERLTTHADAFLFLSQKGGPRFHPDIIMLEGLLNLKFTRDGHYDTAPLDNMPHSRAMFFLQLYDLQFLLSVLDSMSFKRGTSYLPVEKYKSMWLNDTPKINKYVANKLNDLIQQWYVSDERNYRIRYKIKHSNTEQRLYDICEEDFNPAYAWSRYVTPGMRAVLEGDHLTALLPSYSAGSAPDLDAAQAQTGRDAMRAILEGDHLAARSAPYSVSSTSSFDEAQRQGGLHRDRRPRYMGSSAPGFDAAQLRADQDATQSQADQNGFLVRSIEEDSSDTGAPDVAHDDQRGSPSRERTFEAEAEAEASTDSTAEELPAPGVKFTSVQSMSSSEYEDDRQDSPHIPSPRNPGQEFARRFMPRSYGNN